MPPTESETVTPTETFDQALRSLLRVSHLLEPDDLPGTVAAAARRLGADAITIWLADYEQQELRELVPAGELRAAPQVIDSTVAGRVFRTQTPAELGDGSARRLLVPMVNGTTRLGVMELRMPSAHEADDRDWADLVDLTAELLVAKQPYGDLVDVTQRSRSTALRAEAQRELLPPLTLASRRLLVTGMLVPSYEVAGDVFDYALNGDVLHFAIFDAMGHSLSATLTASVALAAYRNSRREGSPLVDRWRVADDAVAREFHGERFATALFGELELRTGLVRSVSAGHPPALVVRDNRVFARCADEPALPLGLGGNPPVVTTTHLQPWDRLLLFTDGIVEARAPDGTFFGEDQLVDVLGRELDSGLPGPEAVRRLVRTVVEHQSGTLRDDATLVLVEWRDHDDASSPPSPG